MPQEPFVGTIRYRDRYGRRVIADWRADDTVRLTINPGAEEQIKKTVTTASRWRPPLRTGTSRRRSANPTVGDAMRTKYMDPDFRRWPKTERYCVLCQRDLKPGQPCRVVRWELDKWEAIHPDDYAKADDELPARRGRSDAVQSGLVGMDCARRLGLEWTAPNTYGL